MNVDNLQVMHVYIHMYIRMCSWSETEGCCHRLVSQEAMIDVHSLCASIGSEEITVVQLYT